MVKKRSVGVTIFGTIITTFGGLPILAYIISVILCGTMNKAIDIWAWRNNSISRTLSTYLTCIAFFIIGLGVLKLKNWSRILLIILMSMNIVAAVAGLCLAITNVFNKSLTIPEIGFKFISLLICVFVIFFFTRPKVKEQFRYELPSKTV